VHSLAAYIGRGLEVGVHRWDVESVLGEHAPIPADLTIFNGWGYCLWQSGPSRCMPVS
jgi:hypothetical protein